MEGITESLMDKDCSEGNERVKLSEQDNSFNLGQMKKVQIGEKKQNKKRKRGKKDLNKRIEEGKKKQRTCCF